MSPRERTLVAVVVACGLCAAVAWSAVRLVDARDAAGEAAASLAECRNLAARVEAQRGPGDASGHGQPIKDAGQSAEVTRRIESAAKLAGFPAGSIERIEPGAVRRVDVGSAQGGERSERPTVVNLRGITVRQALTFFRAVTVTGRPALQLKQVRLFAPSPEDAGDRWTIESTLAYPVRPNAGAGGVTGAANEVD